MPLQKLTAIVLHTKKYKESSLLVYAYTDIFGRQAYIVNGVRSAKNKTGMAMFQPMALLEAVVFHNPKNNLHHLREYRLLQPLYTIPFDIVKNAMALFICETLYKTIREYEPNSELFGFLVRAIIDMDKLENGIANFHLYFLTHLVSYLGYAPGNNYSTETPYFDIQTGKFTTSIPIHNLFFDALQTQLFARLLYMQPQHLSQLVLNREQRNSFIDNILRFINYHFDTPVPVQSASVLREIFA